MPSCLSRRSLPWLALLVWLLLLAGRADAGGSVVTHPRIPGFERSLYPGGWLLLGELNCTSCHKPEPAHEQMLTRKQAPILDGVGQRIQHSYLRKFLLDPQAAKPGTAMPNVLAGVPENERNQLAEELAHFLASTGTPAIDPLQVKRINSGRDLYGKVGCVACHGTRDTGGKQKQLAPTSVPLGDLTLKYTPASLAQFLENPHVTRPSGRMPGLLNNKEAHEVADFLMQGLPQARPAVNVAYTYYEGSWQALPDFSKLKPVSTGEAGGFDIGMRRRDEGFGFKFDGYLKVVKDGNYKFWLTSDDGSKLWVNGQLVVSNDGVHGSVTVNASTRLEKGVHKVTVGMFNLGGPAVLGVQVQGPDVPKQQSLNGLVTLTPEGNPKPEAPTPGKEPFFVVKQDLAVRGRQAFGALGCASCHQLKEKNQPLASTLTSPVLGKLKGAGGCLSEQPVQGVPSFSLSLAQRKALTQVIAELPRFDPEKPGPSRTVQKMLAAQNCFACHVRDKVGGMEEVWNAAFTTTQPEMGDEGRLPPDLSGVGVKLKPEALKSIIATGGIYRPYMHTRMPRFGDETATHLSAAFQTLDRQASKVEPIPAVSFGETPVKVKGAARHMVGGLSLGCIKCHTFAGQKAEGVQGIDLTVMAQRLDRDWFHHYMIDPNKYRPGTRMPSSWPQGQSLLADILDGKTNEQIEAIWVYLNDGTKATAPIGLGKTFIPLIPFTEPIIYRNFIAGGEARAIAVGYPEKAHLCFDANEMRYPMLWQGGFMNAARHWTDRGVGYEPPLGDNILKLPGGPSFAALPSATDPWPTQSAKALGYRFQGYRLNADQRPIFLYSFGAVSVEDFPNAITAKPHPALRRTLTLTRQEPVDTFYFRAMAAQKIELQDKGVYRINGEWIMRIEATVTPVIRDSAGLKELLVPVRFKDGKATIVQEFQW